MLDSSESALTSGDAELNVGDHFVQMYESDRFLIRSLTTFIERGLRAGDAAIVVATGNVRDGVETALRDAGCDVDAATADGRYVALDAADTLFKFMVDQRPDPVLFMESVGELVATTAVKGRRVRIFGEMVALLCAAGQPEAALELEDLWNDLARRHPFTLFCAYPTAAFADDPNSETFQKVCGTHGRVIPAESFVDRSDFNDRLREVALLQQRTVSEDARMKLHEVSFQQRQAREIHDRIVQSLVVAKMALEQDLVDEGLQAVIDALDTAKSVVSAGLVAVQNGNGSVENGAFRRDA